MKLISPLRNNVNIASWESPWCLTVSALIEHFKIFRHSPFPICIVRLVPADPLFQLVWITTKFITQSWDNSWQLVMGKREKKRCSDVGWHPVTGSSWCQDVLCVIIMTTSQSPVPAQAPHSSLSSTHRHQNVTKIGSFSFSLGSQTGPWLLIMSH